MSTQQAVYWSLRVAVAACFIGHGAFGIITKADWVPFFAFMGIPEWLAWMMMPLVGTMDITMGVLTLIFPIRAILLWAVVWGTWTALLRPLTGLGVWEFFERAGNFGVPLALLYLCGVAWGPSWRYRLSFWAFVKAQPRRLEDLSTERLSWILRLTTSLLLLGHGGFGLVMHKQAWVNYFGALGIGADAVQSASLVPFVGGFEVVLAAAVLAKPVPGLLLAVLAWKLGTEFLRPLSGEPFWEFVERGGSYGAPMALLLLRRSSAVASPDSVAGFAGLRRRSAKHAVSATVAAYTK
ncbi:MAG TPA: hypothetical protein VGL99_04820 [Chloroflexota bacterium]